MKVCRICESNESAFGYSRMASSETLRSTMDAAGVVCSLNELSEPTPLCNHNERIYNILQQPQTNYVTYDVSLCRCNIKPCPKQEVNEEYLRENTGIEGHLNAKNKVCFTCYKFHLITLQQSWEISIRTVTF